MCAESWLCAHFFNTLNFFLWARPETRKTSHSNFFSIFSSVKFCAHNFLICVQLRGNTALLAPHNKEIRDDELTLPETRWVSSQELVKILKPTGKLTVMMQDHTFTSGIFLRELDKLKRFIKYQENDLARKKMYKSMIDERTGYLNCDTRYRVLMNDQQKKIGKMAANTVFEKLHRKSNFFSIKEFEADN